MDARITDFRIALGIEAYDRRTWAEEAGIVETKDDPAEAEDERSSGFDKFLWLKSELDRRIRGGSGSRRVVSNTRFPGSSLHRWYEAAAAHRASVAKLLAENGPRRKGVKHATS